MKTARKKTRRFRVPATMTISVYVDVEASSKDEAIEKAEAAPIQGLCWHCATAEPGEWSTGGELDGQPQIEECDVEELGDAEVE